MKRTIFVGFGFLLASLVVVGLVYGQGRQRAAKQVVPGLTSEQQGRIAEIKSVAVAKAAPIRAELLGKIAEIRRLFAVDKPDRQALLTKQTETESMHRRLREVWTDFALEVHEILSPNQRRMWAESGWGMGPGMGLGPGMATGPGVGRGHRADRGGGTGMAVDVGVCPFECPVCPNQP